MTLHFPDDIWRRLVAWASSPGSGEFTLRKNDGRITGGSARDDFRAGSDPDLVLLTEELARHSWRDTDER